MSTVLTYSPSDVVVSICGYVMTGIVSIQVEWGSDSFQIRKGIRGRHTRVQSLDTSATMYLEFLQTSISNDVLNDLLLADKVYQSSRISVSLNDNSGLTKILSTEAFVSGFPQLAFSDDFSNRVWRIEMLESIAEIKGNAKGLPDILDAASSFASGIADNISGYASSAVTSVTDFFT